MKIHLENIKCYTDSKFDFGDEGIALLSGQSGRGKSTIIQGIYFALFGVGVKITSFGKTSCRVTLEFDGMKVMRSKGPGKLLVNDVIEGDAAQEIINKKFGVSFDVTGYIPQNAVKSFIMMSPQDKLCFLEKFAFDDVDLQGIKTRCKDHVSNTMTKLNDAISKLEVATQFIDEMEEPEMIDFPIPVKNNNYDKAIKNESIRQKNTITLISRSEKILNESREKLSDATTIKELIERNSNEIILATDELLAIDMSLVNLTTDHNLENYINELDIIVSNREYNDTLSSYEEYKKQFDDIRTRERDELKRKLDDIDAELWLMYTSDEANELIIDNQSLLKDIQRRNTLISKYKGDIENDDIEILENNIAKNTNKLNSMKLQKESHSCPKCKTLIRFVDNNLVVAGIDDVSNCDMSINDLVKLIENDTRNLAILREITEIDSLYDDELPDMETVQSDITYMTNYKFEQLENEKKKKHITNDIENDIMTETCRSFRNKVNEYKKRLGKIEVREATMDMTEDVLRDMIEKIKTNNREVEYKQNRRNDIQKRIERYTKNNNELLDKIDKNDIDEYIHELQMTVETKETELDELYEKRKKHDSNMSKIEDWKRMKDELSKYMVWEDKIITLQENESNARDEYSAALTLRDKILEAESIAMTNLVESINTHARIYLEDFFEDDPIVVNLRAFKQVQKVTKAQISMDIEYKGMECDFQMLSGGEMSRIVLAYTLALAEMFNSPLLLLDECTASLDQETTNHVFDSIKEHFNGKLTIIVAHQVVTGIFDRSICLDN
jgi:exonuclease SbcC